MRALIGTMLFNLLLVMVVAIEPARAQTLAVLHTFTGQHLDGSDPLAGLIMDSAGNLYGTTAYGSHYNLRNRLGLRHRIQADTQKLWLDIKLPLCLCRVSWG